MRQNFENVTDAELAALFPIILEEHNPAWRNLYLEEEAFLRGVFGDKLIRVSHIGSTSVPGLLAKPIIDTLAEITDDVDLTPITEIILDHGYVVMYPQRDLSAFYDIIAYFKGYTPRGFAGTVVHNHIRRCGDWGELYFRDYLRDNPDVAAAYAALKHGLKERFEHDRDGYTKAKSDFVQVNTVLARAAYPGRYAG